MTATAEADRAALREEIRQAAGQLAALIAPVADTSVPLPRSTWTVGEAAAHIAYANAQFAKLATGLAFIHGDGTPAGLAAANAQALAAFPERGGAPLAEAIVSGAEQFLDALATHPASERVLSPMGEMDLDTLACYLLTHMAIHAASLALGLGQPASLTARQVTLMLPFLVYVMPRVVDRDAIDGLDACIALHLRGGPGLVLDFQRGGLTVGSAPGRKVDCHVSADPVALFLVMMGLKGQWGAIARGKLRTWGRKPWLALRLVSLFDVP